MSDGVVVQAGRGLYSVHTDSGRTVPCRLRGNLKKNLTYPESGNRRHKVETAKKRRETDPIAVGDRVEITIGESGREGVIEKVEPRRASLSRRSGNERERQTLVANLELAVIVFAAAEPRPDPFKIDRFLVLAEDADLETLLIFNKCDLESTAEIDAIADEFAKIGYDTLRTSASADIGIDELRGKLKNRLSAFCGPSGVGKSSLLNAIQPGLKLKTGETGAVTHAGRHTTVRTELLALDFGGWVADTPGLRQVEFWNLDTEDIAFCFPEMAALVGTCRFSDCKHNSEPGCAILAAVKSGKITKRRYQSYIQMASGSGA